MMGIEPTLRPVNLSQYSVIFIVVADLCWLLNLLSF